MNEEQKLMSQEVQEQGRYLYCVGKAPTYLHNFGKIGLEGNEVYIISAGKFCAVVHDCKAEPYKSNNEQKVKKWIQTHQKVIDIATRRLGTVIPFSFDVIIKGQCPNDEVIHWLKTEEDNLKQKLDTIEGKQEFGIQIFFDQELLRQQIMNENTQIQKLQQELKKASKGKAYFLEQKIKTIVQKELEAKTNFYFKDFYGQIRECADHLKVEKIKKVNTLLNFSCLVEKEKVKKLGAALDRINKFPFSVKFTGPWPAYSFV